MNERAGSGLEQYLENQLDPYFAHRKGIADSYLGDFFMRCSNMVGRAINTKAKRMIANVR